MKKITIIIFIVAYCVSVFLSVLGIDEISMAGGPCGGGILALAFLFMLVIQVILFIIALIIYVDNLKWNKNNKGKRELYLAQIFTLSAIGIGVYLVVQISSISTFFYLIPSVLVLTALFIITRKLNQQYVKKHD